MADESQAAHKASVTAKLQDSVPDGYDPFIQAQDDFLEALSPQDLRLFSPCESHADFLGAIRKLDVLGKQKARGQQWLQIIARFAETIEPYFKVVDIFVSSNPQYAAIFWGSLRLVFQLAGNFSTFFEKLAHLFSNLLDALPQYADMLPFCQMPTEAAADPETFKPDCRLRIQKCLEAVYKDIFQIFHATVRVFTRSNGRLKKTPFVVGDLMWRPFDSRFNELLYQMKEHRQTLLDEISLWATTSLLMQRTEMADERKKALLERHLNNTEREEAAKERGLAQEERRLMAEERKHGCEDRQRTILLLTEVRKEMETLRTDRIERAREKVEKWLSPPSFVDVYEQAAHLRLGGTTSWVFEEPIYKNWLYRGSSSSGTSHKFGQNALWIYGHPGSGKTVLASAIVESLKFSDTRTGKSQPHAYYYFFSHQDPSSCSPVAAYRAILSQLLWERRNDQELLDRFVFIMKDRDQGQNRASEAILLDLLRLCLNDTDSLILVLDGIDECDENESLVRSLVKLSFHSSCLKIIFFSRINVPQLKRCVPILSQLPLPKVKLSQDIRLYLEYQTGELIEEGILLEMEDRDRDTIVGRLARGADGMFLWAKLMINFIRLPFLTPKRRMKTIAEENLPEGLEELYERIVSFIAASGRTSITIASRVLCWLAYTEVAMSSAQLGQALIADGCMTNDEFSGDVTEFEDIAIMACAGLVEQVSMESTLLHSSGTRGLRLVHLSIRELIKQQMYTAKLSSNGFKTFLLDPVDSCWYLTNCCLRQMLYHTPAEPLSGKFHGNVSAEHMSEHFCFTDYAAVHWLRFVQRGVEALQDRRSGETPAVSQRSDLFDEPLTKAIDSLSVLMKSPRVMSVWLESFYTARNNRHTIGLPHPQSHILISWVDKAQSTGDKASRLTSEFLQDVRELCDNIEQIIGTWGERLDQSPEIIWDEMTGFIQSRFFFSPDSTRVTLQEPRPPSIPSIGSTLIATVSRTSSCGTMKGVLSIWRPGSGENLPLDSSNLRQACTGWLAIYELYRLDANSGPFAKVKVPIDPEELSLSLSRYFNSPGHASEIDISLSIDPGTRLFIVLRTLYAIKAGAKAETYQTSQALLPVDIPGYEHEFKLKLLGSLRPCLYTVHFGPSGNLFVLVETCSTSTQPLPSLALPRIHPAVASSGVNTILGHLRLRTFRYGVEDDVRIDKDGELDLEGIDDVEHIAFHPNRAILAFQAIWWSEDGFQRAICTWSFQKSQDLVVREIETQGPLADLHFSSCGTHIVAMPRQQEGGLSTGPIVVPVPEHFMSDEALVTCSEEAQNSRQTAFHATTQSLSSPHQINLQMPSKLPETLTVASHRSAEGSVSTMSAQQSGGEIQLSRTTPSGVETVKLVALPSWSGLKYTTQTLIAPREPGAPLKISIDKSAMSSYPLEGSSAAQVPPSTIERDPRFINTSTMLRVYSGLQGLRQILSSSELHSRKREIEETGFEKEDERLNDRQIKR